MDETVAYILLIDGIDRVFCTTEQLPNAYAVTIGFASVYPGLRFPQNLPCRIEVRDGMLSGTTASFEIADVDDSLAALFGVSIDTADSLLVKIDPSDTAPAATWGKHVGTERIGAAGQRRRHPCVPGFNVGMQHVSETQAYVNGLAAAPVSDSAVLWAGRRCAVYRLTQDDGGSWPDLNDEATRLACRVWWGTLLGQGTQAQHTWTLRAAGQESWLMGVFGQGVTQSPYVIDVSNELDESENQHLLAARLDIVDVYGTPSVAYTYVVNTTDTTLSGAITYDEIADAFHTFLEAIAADAGLGSALSSEGFSALRFSKTPNDDGVQVRWDRDAITIPDGPQNMLRLTVLAHPKVWKILGYSPAEQNSGVDPIDDAAIYGQFFKPFGKTTEDAVYVNWASNYPNHWAANFYSGDSVAMKGYEDGLEDMTEEHTNNGGGWRRWPPIYPSGTNTFDYNQYRQVFRLRTFDAVYLPSSKAVPLPEDPEDPTAVYNIAGVGDVTHQGLLFFEGPYRDETVPDADVVTLHQIARVAWRENSDGSVATDSEGYPTLVVYQWPTQKLYGIDAPDPLLWSAWRVPPAGATPHTARSLIGIESSISSDRIAAVFARMLATTGTAGEWYTDDTLTTPAFGLSSPAVQDVGANDLGLTGVGPELAGRFTDAETSTLGLAVPREMIATSADQVGGLENALAEMADDLYWCKVALGKPTSARDVVRTMLAPTGWCVSLAGGRYGLFDPFSFKTPPTISGVVTAESLAGKPGDPSAVVPDQQLRKDSPIDTIELKARVDVSTNAFAVTESTRSSDPGAIYRAQNIKHNIDGSHMVHPKLGNTPGSSWRTSYLQRWRTGCRWWARQHFEATMTVPARRAVEFFPGSPVSVSSEWLVDPTAASYGITQAAGYVVELNINAEKETAEVRCLVEAGAVRLYAPSALVTRYDEDDDGEGYRLICEDDYLGMRQNTGTFDVEGFAEPEWSITGGELEIEVFSFDGANWSGGIYGTVASVHAEDGNSYITLTEPLGGTWLRDQWHIVVPLDASFQEAAWPFAILGIVGEQDGSYAGGDQVPKFKDA